MSPGEPIGFRAGGEELVTLGRLKHTGELNVWRMSDGAWLRGVRLDVENRVALLSPDGRVALVCEEGTGAFGAWAIETGERLGRLTGEVALPLNGLRLTRDGRQIIAPRLDGSLVAVETPIFLRASADDDGLRLQSLGINGPFELESRTAPEAPWEPTGTVFDDQVLVPIHSDQTRWYRARLLHDRD